MSPRIPLAIILSSPPGFIYFVSVSISTVNWNFSKLLLLYGSVESNSGPRPIDKNPVFCTICSSKINRGIQQSMAPTCSEANCYAWCHQACNGLKSNQNRQAKSCRRTITWKCSQHGTGIAEIVIPPPPVFELPTRTSTASKLCLFCNPILSCSIQSYSISFRLPSVSLWRSFLR